MSFASLSTAFDIAALIKEIFGNAPAFVDSLPTRQENGPYGKINPSVKKEANLYGQPFYSQSDTMGQKVFCPLTIEVDGKDYNFPYAVIGIERTKTVVNTPMTELNGSVKEIIGNQDYLIDIRGFVIGDYDNFPDEQLKALNDVHEHNKTVRLKSAYSDIFLHNNDNILITKLTIPQKPAVIGVRDFSLQAMSDGIFNLYVT